jgi:hypothetical protein
MKLSDIKTMVAENKIDADAIDRFARILEQGSANNVINLDMPVPAKIRAKISLAYLESASTFAAAVNADTEKQMELVKQGISILDTLWENLFQEALTFVSEEKMVDVYSNMADIVCDKTNQINPMETWAEGFIFMYEMSKKLNSKQAA